MVSCSRLCFLLVLGVLLPAFNSPPRDDLLVTLSDCLELNLEGLSTREGAPGEELLDELADLLDRDREELAGIQVHDARARIKLGPLTELTLVTVPTKGATFALAVLPSGTVAAAGAFDAEELTAGSKVAWHFFFEQFTRKTGMSQVLDPLEVSDALMVEDILELLHDEEEEEQRLHRTLYRHRLLMLGNGYYSTAVFDRLKNKVLPEAELLVGWQKILTDLVELAPRMAPVLDRATLSEYVKVAEEGAGILQQARATRAKADLAGLDRVLGAFSQQICARCHGLRSKVLDARRPIFSALSDRLGDLGLRRDLARVGTDIWPVPGHEKLSQTLAEAAKLALLVLGSEE